MKNWRLKRDEKNYVTWERIDKRVGWYNKFTLVVKLEFYKWVVFLDGQDAGVTILYQSETKASAIKYAKNYMRKN